MKIFLSAVAWLAITFLYWAIFGMSLHTVWVPNLSFLVVIILGLYASRWISIPVAVLLALQECLTGSSLYFHVLWYPAVALGLNHFFYNVFRSHPIIFRSTHLGLIVLDMLLAMLWTGLSVQKLPPFHPVWMILFVMISSGLAYALRFTGAGFFENRKTDSVWRKTPTYRLAFKL